MILPTIHRNGTSREELIKNNMDAAILLGKAIDALCLGRPHGRDYYPQDKGAIMGENYRKASAEHESRISKVNEVFKELLAIHEYLSGENN